MSQQRKKTTKDLLDFYTYKKSKVFFAHFMRVTNFRAALARFTS